MAEHLPSMSEFKCKKCGGGVSIQDCKDHFLYKCPRWEEEEFDTDTELPDVQNRKRNRVKGHDWAHPCQQCNQWNQRDDGGLSEFAALPEDTSSISSTHMRRLTTICMCACTHI